jgi:hypothetical protein
MVSPSELLVSGLQLAIVWIVIASAVWYGVRRALYEYFGGTPPEDREIRRRRR